VARVSSPTAQGASSKAPDEPRSDGALADWEDEGGSARAIPPGHVEREQVRRVPPLPPGHEARSVWMFRDKTGRFSYEFSRVYGPPAWPDQPAPQRPLDEGLSYWGVTWSTFDEQGQERPEGRWVTFSQARERRGARLTFERFSSLTRMIDSLPGLLRVRELFPDPPAGETPPAGASPAGGPPRGH